MNPQTGGTYYYHYYMPSMTQTSTTSWTVAGPWSVGPTYITPEEQFVHAVREHLVGMAEWGLKRTKTFETRQENAMLMSTFTGLFASLTETELEVAAAVHEQGVDLIESMTAAKGWSDLTDAQRETALTLLRDGTGATCAVDIARRVA